MSKPKPIEYRDQSLADFGEAYRAGLVENPCSNCYGEGYGGDCEPCEGTGSAECPNCRELSAYLVFGDGRCPECITANAVDLVEDIEAAEQLACLRAEYRKANDLEAVHHGFKVFADADGNGKNSRLLGACQQVETA